MQSYLRLSFSFLDGSFHGRRDGGVNEWPPSPMRAFQALVAAAAARWHNSVCDGRVASALKWLASLEAPEICAPSAQPGTPIRIAVPNNDLDIVAASWSKRQKPKKQPNELKTMKTVCPCLFDETQMIEFLWPVCGPIAGEAAAHIEILEQAARSVIFLGWGVDLVAGHCSVISADLADRLPGERWRPTTTRAGTLLRTPRHDTLEELVQRHRAFQNRMANDVVTPVAPLSAFNVAGYCRSIDPPARPWAAFDISNTVSIDLQSFDTPRHATSVAGMVRHALAERAKQQRPFGWGDAEIATIVLGHAPGEVGGPARLELQAPRLAYLPLPSIQRRSEARRTVGAILRVMVAGRPGMDEVIAWAQRALAGVDIIEEQTHATRGILSVAPGNHYVLRQYTRPAATWTTVTPVVLPGYDDRSGTKTEKLVRKALAQAGFSRELVEHAELDWRPGGFLHGIQLASQYRRPANVSQAPVIHLKIKWYDRDRNPVAVSGPIAVGSGRFRGLGLFATFDEV